MKRLLYVYCIVFLWPSFAAAETSANAGSASGAIAGFKAEQGAFSNHNANTASGGAATASNGNMNLQNGNTSANASITFPATKAPNIPPPAAVVPYVESLPVSIYGQLDETANGRTALNMTFFYARVCPPKAVRGYENELKPRSYDGMSGKTRIIFSPHLNYAKVTKKPPTDPSFIMMPTTSPPKVDVEEVTESIGGAGRFKCLGIVTVVAKGKEAGEATPATVMADALSFPLREMEGFPKIILLSTYDAFVATRGVDHQGRGFAGGLGLSKFFDPLLVTAGGSATANEGATLPVEQVAATYFVLVEDPKGIEIDFSPRKPPQPVPPKPEPAPLPKTEPQPMAPVPPLAPSGEAKPAAKSEAKPQGSTVVPKSTAPKKASPPKVIVCKGCTLDGKVTLGKR